MSGKERIMALLLLILFASTSLGWSWGDILQNRAQRAMRLYEEGKIEEAIELYREEAIENPDRPDVSFNMANMLYRAGKFQDALPLYGRAGQSAERDLQEKVLYNTGTSLAKIGIEGGDPKALEKALDAFKGAMRLAPDDRDPKYNYEFVQRLLSREAQSGDTSSSPDSSTNGEEKEQEKKQEEGENAAGGEGEKKASEEREPSPPPGEEEHRDSDTAKRPPKSMTQEDAQRMLEALLGKEEEQLAKQFRMLWPERVDVEKDW